MKTYKVTFNGGYYGDIKVINPVTRVESFEKEMSDADLQYYFDNPFVTGELQAKSDWEDLFN